MFDLNRLLRLKSSTPAVDFNAMLNWKLLRGSHEFPGPDGGTCINEAAIVAAGYPYRSVQSIDDCPTSFSRPMALFAMCLNDALDDDLRQELLMQFVTRLPGSADAPRTRARTRAVPDDADRNRYPGAGAGAGRAGGAGRPLPLDHDGTGPVLSRTFDPRRYLCAVGVAPAADLRLRPRRRCGRAVGLRAGDRHRAAARRALSAKSPRRCRITFRRRCRDRATADVYRQAAAILADALKIGNHSDLTDGDMAVLRLADAKQAAAKREQAAA